MKTTRKPHSPGSLMVLALGLAVTMTALFWPGVGTWETLHYAAQKRLPVMHDWQSAFIAGMYWFSTDVFGTTGPILLLQQLVFWSGLWLTTVHAIKPFAAKVLFLLVVAALPPIWVTEIMLWKEAWTLSFLSMSIGGSLALIRTGHLRYTIIAAAAAIFLAATRQNAILLAWPTMVVVAAAIHPVKGRHGPSLAVTGAVFVILLSLMLAFSFGINKLNKQRCYIWSQALLWDIAAISLAEGENLIPPTVYVQEAPRSLDYLDQYFTIHYSDPLFSYRGSPLKLYGTPWGGCHEKPPIDLVLDRWSAAIVAHPTTYAKHRLTYFAHLLDILSKDSTGAAYYPIDTEVSPRVNQSEFFERIRKTSWYRAAVREFLLPGWIYPLVTFCALIGLPLQKSRRHVYLWLVWLSGLLYLGSYFVIGSGAVLRYLTVFALLGPSLVAARWGGMLGNDGD